MTKRNNLLDIFRGIAMMFVVFFHTSVYNFANIHLIDFSDPPISVVLISFLVLWGGILIVYSGFVNTLMLTKRAGEKKNTPHYRYLIIAGALLLVFHYLLNVIFGRWANDFVNNQPNMTLIAASLRNMHITFPHISKFFEGSSLSTIGLNLIAISLIFRQLFKKNGIDKEKRNYLILLSSGFFIMLFSFVRIPLHSLFIISLEAGNYLGAGFLSFFLANPYPLLPYMAYGLFSSAAALMFYRKRFSLMKKVMIPVGFFFLVFGLVGSMNFEKTISTPDFFWYFKTQLELGIFILILISGLLLSNKFPKLFKRPNFISWFSRVSLTIYLLETALSELLRIAATALAPGWNQTIEASLAFGGINVLIWIVILNFWKKNGFKYSIEYFWVELFKRIGKESTKLDKPL